MRRLQAMGAALLIVCALSAVAATTAQAEEAPYWSIEGTRLSAGKTFEITAKAVGEEGDVNKPVVLGGGDPVEVACTGLKFAKGSVLLGSNAGEPGKGTEKIEYSGCTVKGNGSPCEVEKGEVKTEQLTNELAYETNKKSLVMTYKASSGKTYATAHYTGTGCLTTGAKITGEPVARVYTDAEPPVLLELPNSGTPAESFLFDTPREEQPAKIWLIKGGTGSSVETEPIEYAGLPGYVSGTILVLLAEKGKSIEKKWCPLF
jgi:hypothetical protein